MVPSLAITPTSRTVPETRARLASSGYVGIILRINLAACTSPPCGTGFSTAFTGSATGRATGAGTTVVPINVPKLSPNWGIGAALVNSASGPGSSEIIAVVEGMVAGATNGWNMRGRIRLGCDTSWGAVVCSGG